MMIKIEGMNCQHCVRAVEQALSEISGLSDIKVKIGEAEFTAADSVTLDQIKLAVDDAGYKVV